MGACLENLHGNRYCIARDSPEGPISLALSRAAPLNPARSAPDLRRLPRRVVRANHPPVGQIDQAIPIPRIRLGVGYLDDRRAFVIELLEKLHDLLALAGVQV